MPERHKWVPGGRDTGPLIPDRDPPYRPGPPFMEPSQIRPDGTYIRPPFAPNERPFPDAPRPDERSAWPGYEQDVDPRRFSDMGYPDPTYPVPDPNNPPQVPPMPTPPLPFEPRRRRE